MNTIFFFWGGGEEASHYLSLVGDRSLNFGENKMVFGEDGGGDQLSLTEYNWGGGCRKLTAHANEGRRNRTLGGSGIFNWNKFLHCFNYSSIYSCIKKKSVSRGLFSTL